MRRARGAPAAADASHVAGHAPARLAAYGLVSPQGERSRRVSRELELERLRELARRPPSPDVRERGLGPCRRRDLPDGLGRYEHGLVGDLGLGHAVRRAPRPPGAQAEDTAEAPVPVRRVGPGWRASYLLAEAAGSNGRQVERETLARDADRGSDALAQRREEDDVADRSRPVSTIASRSMPRPSPPVGGMPYESAST